MKLVDSLRNSFVGRVKRTHSFTSRVEGHEDPATISASTVLAKRPKPSKKTVSFALEHNVCHDSTYTLNDQVEITDLWYTMQDYSLMKREMKQQVTALRISEKVFGDEWAKSLTKIYRVLSSASSDSDDITSIVTAVPKDSSDEDKDSDDTLGLETRAVRHVAADIKSRKHDLRDLVLAMQDRHMSEQDIAEACQSLSAPSRHFARFVALQLEADQLL